MKPDQIEQAAADLQRRINQEIADRCEDYPPMAWRALADQVVEDLLDRDQWDYVQFNTVGRPPQIAITQYYPPRKNRYDGDPRQCRYD